MEGKLLSVRNKKGSNGILTISAFAELKINHLAKFNARAVLDLPLAFEPYIEIFIFYKLN